MDSLLLTFGTVKLQWQTVVLSFMVAFSLSSVIAVVYEKTFVGLSWSKGFLQSMILGSIISCLLMIAIGDNVARGIGIVGSLAVIRFRTNLRDPRDLIFLFAALGSGVAAGVQSYVAGFFGTVAFCLATIGLYYSPVGSRDNNDGVVRFQIPADDSISQQAIAAMKNIVKTFALITMRDVAQGDYHDYSYQIKLYRDEDTTRLVRELEKIEGMRGLTYMSRQNSVEV